MEEIRDSSLSTYPERQGLEHNLENPLHNGDENQRRSSVIMPGSPPPIILPPSPPPVRVSVIQRQPSGWPHRVTSLHRLHARARRRNRGLSPHFGEIVSIERRVRLEGEQERRERQAELRQLDAQRVEVVRKRDQILLQMRILARSLLEALREQRCLPSTADS